MPRANQDLPAIDPTESVNVTADSWALAAGETIQSDGATWSIALISGVDPFPVNRLLGAPVVPAPGNVTIQKIGTCQPGAVYDIIVTVITTAGQTLTTNAHLQCNPIT